MLQLKRLVLFMFFLFGYYYSMSQNFFFKPIKYLVFDSITGKGLVKQCGSRDMPKNISGYWTLNLSDIELLQNNFGKIINLRSNLCCNKGYKVSDLKQYGFQYLGVVVENRKYIYLNAFPISRFDRRQPVIVCDGGIQFWGALFSMDELSFSQLAFNGPPVQTIN